MSAEYQMGPYFVVTFVDRIKGVATIVGYSRYLPRIRGQKRNRRKKG